MAAEEGPGRGRWSARRWWPLGVALAGSLVLAGCGAGPDGRATPVRVVTPTADAGPDLSRADLWLSFEDESVGYDGSAAYRDELGGPYTGRVVTANGGTVRRAVGVDGSAASLAFPRLCTAPTGCPRAMVEVTANAALDPGADPFEYGAAVWLDPGQTTTGSNIVQQGRFGTDGGQWKLQVDSEEGEPSCVVRGDLGAVVVRSSATVADADWHRVSCRRDERGVSIRVDDTVDRVAGRTGRVSSALPIRVGSPGVDDQDDQFHGRIDDVFLRLGQPS